MLLAEKLHENIWRYVGIGKFKLFPPFSGNVFYIFTEKHLNSRRIYLVVDGYIREYFNHIADKFTYLYFLRVS